MPDDPIAEYRATSTYEVVLCATCGKPKPCPWVILNDTCKCVEVPNDRHQAT